MNYRKMFGNYGMLLSVMLLLLLARTGNTQGNIYGNVNNADLTTPADGEISFIGYLDDTDEEIRIESSVGAGYDNGNWFDDFQNFLTEAAGNPYDYHFYNLVSGEGHILSQMIPDNSFQEENISLASISWPAIPLDLSGLAAGGPSIEISWSYIAGLTYHIYRRDATSGGSFFRIDDPAGLLSNPGVAESPYFDNTVDGSSSYDYLIIAENSSGYLSPHSDYITVSSTSFICGDVNNDGAINILDIVYLIEYKYKEGPPPEYWESGEVNGDGRINILDVVYLIEYRYKDGPEPTCPE